MFITKLISAIILLISLLEVVVWGYSGSDNEIVQFNSGPKCELQAVAHFLQHEGCETVAIPSFRCSGKCASYVQVSGSKIWQMERTCNCCQESGEREATVVLTCLNAKTGEKKLRKVTTKAPLECMCRPCSDVEESAIIPQEIVGFAEEGPLHNHFRKSL